MELVLDLVGDLLVGTFHLVGIVVLTTGSLFGLVEACYHVS